MIKLSRIRGAVAALFIGAGLACSDGGTSATSPRTSVDAVTVTPASVPLAVGSTAQLSATAYDPQGNAVSGRQVFWASADSTVASVTSAGLVTAQKIGAVQIQAAIDGKPAYAFVLVGARPVGSVAVAPNPTSVAAGGSTQLQAVVKDDQGNAVTDRPVLWTSSNDAVARVTSTGLVSGVAPGSAAISATAEGKGGSAAVTVTGTVAPPGTGGGSAVVARVSVVPSPAAVRFKETVQLTATAFDASDRVITGRAVQWVSRDAGVAPVGANGLVEGKAIGETYVVATIDGKRDSTRLTVQRQPVRTVDVASPQPLEVGSHVDLVATPRDAAGAQVNDRAVTWSSSDDAVIHVFSTGPTSATAEARKGGAAIVTATVEGEGVSTATLIIVNAPTPAPARVASVDLSPSSTALTTGGTQQLTPTARDGSRNVLSGRTFTWTSSNTGVATVNAAGLVTAVGMGTATITVTSEGVSGNAAVTVAAPPSVPAASVVVSPSASTLNVGQTQLLAATPRDATGATLSGRTVTWSSSNSGVARVDGSGLVTAVAPGSATITATSEGASGTAAITVPAPTVATVAVTPPSTSLAVGQTQQLTAAARTASGAELTGRTVTWTSTRTSVATVGSSGIVTAVGAGTATITATVDGVSGTSAITVTTPPAATVARVATTPPTWTMKEGDTKQFTATTYDAGGKVLTGRTCTWASNSTAHATVDNTGEVRAVKATKKGPPIPNDTLLITATCDGKSGSSSVVIN